VGRGSDYDQIGQILIGALTYFGENDTFKERYANKTSNEYTHEEYALGYTFSQNIKYT
jgi:hypothetical protein